MQGQNPSKQLGPKLPKWLGKKNKTAGQKPSNQPWFPSRALKNITPTRAMERSSRAYLTQCIC
jgi:hypothetical protein